MTWHHVVMSKPSKPSFWKGLREALREQKAERKKASTAYRVQVSFRDIEDFERPLPTGKGYTYIWDLPTPPAVGIWVYVPGLDGLATAVVVRVGASVESRGMRLKKVAGIVPAEKFKDFDF